MSAQNIISELKKKSDPNQSRHLSRFFKTGIGEYGYGDLFFGIDVPTSRTISKKYQSISLEEIFQLLKNPYHECRLIGLLILVSQYEKAKSDKTKEEIFNFYLSNLKYVNNWDLVDSSAHKILGCHLFRKSSNLQIKLAKSSSLWERRIAIISTFYDIYQQDFKKTLEISLLLMHDQEDLIHKATGWMLREVGKRCSEQVLIQYLDKYSNQMPRTMLRYAIERLPKNYKEKYLNKKL